MSETLSFAKIALGAGFTCGLTTDGATYCWGANSIGQLGDGKPISYGNAFIATPNQVVGGHTFQSISQGQSVCVAVTTVGQGYCWGRSNTKLGAGNTNDSSSPVPMIGGLSFQRISTGCGSRRVMVTPAVSRTPALCIAGARTARELGSAGPGTGTPTLVAGFQSIEVAASGIGTGSGSHSCAISKDRLTVRCWGRNDTGQLGNGATSTAATPNASPSIVVGQRPL